MKTDDDNPLYFRFLVDKAEREYESQPTSPEMAPERLKAEFGDRLVFHGGIDMQRLLPQGTPEEVMQAPESITGRYLSGSLKIDVPTARRAVNPKQLLELEGASGNNLRDVTVQFPLGALVRPVVLDIAGERHRGAHQ